MLMVHQQDDGGDALGKLKCVEIIIRGDLLLRRVVLKIGERLQASELAADFTSTIVVPPFRMAMRLQYPSLAVLHALVEAEDLYKFRTMLEEILEQERCQIVSIETLEHL